MLLPIEFIPFTPHFIRNYFKSKSFIFIQGLPDSKINQTIN